MVAMYSILPNRHVYTLISGKVCRLGSIKVKRQTLPEINVYTRLFGCIEYLNVQSFGDSKNAPNFSYSLKFDQQMAPLSNSKNCLSDFCDQLSKSNAVKVSILKISRLSRVIYSSGILTSGFFASK